MIRDGGVTLIEVVLALLLMGISAAAATTAINSAVNLRARIDLVSGGREPPLYLVERLWRGSVGAGCSPRRVGLYPPVT